MTTRSAFLAIPVLLTLMATRSEALPLKVRPGPKLRVRPTRPLARARVTPLRARSRSRVARRRAAAEPAGPLPQTRLAETWAAAESRGPATRYVKETVAGFEIPAQARGLSDLPRPMRELLGKVDETKYSDAYIREHRGDFVAVQFKKDGSPDLYVAEKTRQAYDFLDDAGPLAAQLRSRAADLGIAPGSLQMMRKKGTTEMRPASELGMPARDKATIQSPWGDTQTKPAGSDAFVVRNGDEFYLVQREAATGLPVGYQVATPRPRPAPPPASAAASGTGPFGL